VELSASISTGIPDLSPIDTKAPAASSRSVVLGTVSNCANSVLPRPDWAVNASAYTAAK
jgi:hypothetical protein